MPWTSIVAASVIFNMTTTRIIARRAVLIATIVILSVGLDQVTKAIAVDLLKGQPKISYLGDIFRWQYAENSGGFLSLGSELPPVIKFILMRILPLLGLSVILTYTLITPLPTLTTVLLSLLCGGGLSNLVDRLANSGQVVDFMNMGIGSLRTGIFNVADVLIMIGGIGMVVVNIKPLHFLKKSQG